PWSDGGWLASENSLAEIGMASLDFFPTAFLPPDVFGPVPAPPGNAVAHSRSRSEYSPTDGKDSPDEMLGPSLYYGGEDGGFYGQLGRKSGGDLWERSVVGGGGSVTIY